MDNPLRERNVYAIFTQQGFKFPKEIRPHEAGTAHTLPADPKKNGKLHGVVTKIRKSDLGLQPGHVGQYTIDFPDGLIG